MQPNRRKVQRSRLKVFSGDLPTATWSLEPALEWAAPVETARRGCVEKRWMEGLGGGDGLRTSIEAEAVNWSSPVKADPRERLGLLLLLLFRSPSAGCIIEEENRRTRIYLKREREEAGEGKVVEMFRLQTIDLAWLNILSFCVEFD